MASVGIEDEDGTVFARDFDWLAGLGALVEQLDAWLVIVGRRRQAGGWRLEAGGVSFFAKLGGGR